MYVVYDNDKPASVEGFPTLTAPCWRTHKFHTWRTAHEYAKAWLGQWAPFGLEVNVPYDYDGYGDVIEIRLEEDSSPPK